jgi:predicted transcriptional regulator
MTAINDYITNDYAALDSLQNVADAQDFFLEAPFSNFPVLQEGIYVGCIAADDVETFDMDKPLSEYRYVLEGFFARKSMMWLDVLEVFAKNHTNIVPVLDDENNQYLGYYELEDIIKFFHETPFLKEQGGIIVVQKSLNDYAMSQIAQIVESNNAKMLGAFISDVVGDQVEITVKIAVGPMNDIIQTFRRYNYTIVSEHHDDIFLNNLKERSEYLDRFLNI